MLQGGPAEAIARLGPEVPELTWWYEVLLLTVLAEAYADSGDAVKAEEVAAGAVGRARATRNRVDGVEALRVRAKGLSMRGRPEEASAALEEALSWACPMPYPYAEARILYEYGMPSTKESPEGRGSGSPRLWTSSAGWERRRKPGAPNGRFWHSTRRSVCRYANAE